MYEVTIGIPVYRAADYIGATMQSALAQTFASIEFLVVDDCGADGSMAVVERLQQEHPRGRDIRILRQQQNMGVGKSRNRIIDEAEGRYLYFLDSDDTIEPFTIELLVNTIQQHKAEIVYASYERIDTINHTPTEQHVYPDISLLQPDALAAYAFSNYGTFQVSVCNWLVDLRFLRSTKVQFIDAMFWEDMAFTYDLVSCVSRAVLLPQVTYHYLCRPHSLSNYQDRDVLDKEEVLKNASTVDYLKWKAFRLRDKAYVSDFCHNLQMNSFYIVCYIMKHNGQIKPSINRHEMRHIMRHPMPLREIVHFRSHRATNIMLWAIAKLPLWLFMLVVKTLGHFKKVI